MKFYFNDTMAFDGRIRKIHSTMNCGRMNGENLVETDVERIHHNPMMACRVCDAWKFVTKDDIATHLVSVANLLASINTL